jgi:hypothetical protein
MTALRKALPPRRASETFTVVHWNQVFVVTVGFYDDGTPGEVFISTGKGGDAAAVARDAAVTLSLGLQHGVPIESIQHAITRNGASGAPASIIGAVIDALAGVSS